MIELAVDDLHLTYGDNPVLKGVSMNLKRGEVVSLLGPSGSGKTTLLRAVAGLENRRRGRLSLATIKFTTARRAVRSRQKSVTWGWCSSPMPCGRTKPCLRTWPIRSSCVKFRPKIQQRVQDVLDQLGLGHLGKRHPHQLSGGQQQRVAVAGRWCTTHR